MEITDIDSQLYLGKHETCYPGDSDAVADAELDDECKATTVVGFSGDYAKFNVATDKCSLDTDREVRRRLLNFQVFSLNFNRKAEKGSRAIK